MVSFPGKCLQLFLCVHGMDICLRFIPYAARGVQCNKSTTIETNDTKWNTNRPERENEKILKYNHRLCVLTSVCAAEYIFAKTLLWKCGSPFLPWLLDCKHHLYMVSILVSYTLLNFKLMVSVCVVWYGMVWYARHVGSVVYTSRDRKYKHCIFAFVHMNKTVFVIDRGGGTAAAAAAKHLKYMLIHWTILCLCFLFSHYLHVAAVCAGARTQLSILAENEYGRGTGAYWDSSLWSKWCLINHLIWLYNSFWNHFFGVHLN